MRQFLFVFLSAVCSYAAQTSLVVVVNSGDATETVYEAVRMSATDQTLKLLKALPTGKGPQETCISPDGKRLYVSNFSNRSDISITVIDLDNLAVASTIFDPGMKNPDGRLASADGTKLLLSPDAGYTSPTEKSGLSVSSIRRRIRPSQRSEPDVILAP